MKKKYAALLLAGAMTLSVFASPMKAMAEGEGGGTTPSQEQTSDKLEFTKRVLIADGVTIDSTKEFSFTATRYDHDSVATGAQNADDVTMPSSAPQTLTIPTFTFGQMEADGESSSRIKTIEVTGIDNVLSEDGEYTYVVKENAIGPSVSDTTSYGWINDTKEYLLHIYRTNGTSRYSFTLAGQDAKATPVFNNKYTSKASLKIEKTVSDSQGYANADDTFVFHVAFTNNNTYNSGVNGSYNVNKDSYSYKVYNSDNNQVNDENGNPIQGSIATGGGNISLKSGEYALFDDIPAGTQTTVTENAKPNYIPKVKVIENGGTAVVTDGGTVNQSLTAVNAGHKQAVLVGDKGTTMEFTNTFRTINATGVVTNIAPFVMMMVAAVAAVALYLVAKRKLRR